MKASQCCGTCMFVEKTSMVGQGICRRNPPTAVPISRQGMIPGTADMGTMSCWPPVKLNDKGCGEYKPRLETVGATEEDAG